MPRMLRFHAPGALAHVMARGIDGKAVFGDDQDREEFLKRLSAGLRRVGFRCLAWCLMPNHYHIVCRTNENPLSKLMRPANAGYARWYNHKYGRKGYLFQDRFKSVLCQDQDYARELVRYVHLNPIRGGLVKSLKQLRTWCWCGHGFLVGERDARGADFQNRTEVLRRFGSNDALAVREYLRFLEEGLDESSLPHAGSLDETASFEVQGSQKGWPAVIGDPDFARSAMQNHEVGVRRRHRQADYDQVMRSLADSVCSVHSIDSDDLYSRGRDGARSRARIEFCRRAHLDEKIPYAVIARHLGVTLSAVPNMLAREKARGR